MGSIFKSRATEEEYYLCYDKSLNRFGLEGTSYYISTSFGDTYVLCFGDPSKKPLILLHGMTMSSTMWYPNMKQLIQERCVYAVDIVGDFGRSKPTVAIKNRKAANQWLLEVLDAMQFNKVDLAGHSMGGFLSLNFALDYPGRVSKLLLFAPAGTFYKISFKFLRKFTPHYCFTQKSGSTMLFCGFQVKESLYTPYFVLK